MATGCDISLQLREGFNWHQRCREHRVSRREKGAGLQCRVGGAAVLGEGAAPCTVPCSIFPGSTQAQRCRGWGCCGYAKCDQALCSSACHRLRALPPIF